MTSAISVFERRIKNLQKLIKGDCVLLVTNPISIYYLCGYKSCEKGELSILVSPGKVLYFTFRMFAEEAEELGLEKIIIQHANSRIEDYINKRKFDCVYFEEYDLTVKEHSYYEEIIKASFEPFGSGIKIHRSVKDKKEIEKLVKVANITSDVFISLIEFLRQNKAKKLSEFDVALKIRELGEKLGVDEFSFAPIVAFGKNSSKPHYKPSRNVELENGPLLLDFGFKLDGYVSDLTRTIHLGSASCGFKKNYELVRECGKRCMDTVNVETTFNEIQETAGKYLEQMGVKDKFIHSIGHGIGLEIHESPFVSKQGDVAKLENGNAITIEPGLYFENNYGIRIEDSLVIGGNPDGSNKALSDLESRELIELL